MKVLSNSKQYLKKYNITIIFTGEKDFTLEIAKNYQNNHVYGQQKQNINPCHHYYESSGQIQKP